MRSVAVGRVTASRYARAALPSSSPVIEPAPPRSRRRAGCALAAVAVLLLAAPRPAAAQLNNPLAPLGGNQTTSTATASAATTTSGTSTGGGSTGVVALVIGVAVVLLAGIAWLIVRDARRAAPMTSRPRGAPPARSADRVRRERERAKAARRQRKRNR
jgi:hypothetical protein